MYTVNDLFDLEHTLAADYLRGFTYPHEALSGIKAMIRAVGAGLSADEYEHVRETVWIARSARIAETAFIGDDVVIGPETEVRPVAFIRGGALIQAHAMDIDEHGRLVIRTERGIERLGSGGVSLKIKA